MQVEFEFFLTLYHYVAGKPLMVKCKGILGICMGKEGSG